MRSLAGNDTRPWLTVTHAELRLVSSWFEESGARWAIDVLAPESSIPDDSMSSSVAAGLILRDLVTIHEGDLLMGEDLAALIALLASTNDVLRLDLSTGETVERWAVAGLRERCLLVNLAAVPAGLSATPYDGSTRDFLSAVLTTAGAFSVDAVFNRRDNEAEGRTNLTVDPDGGLTVQGNSTSLEAALAELFEVSGANS